MILSKIHLRDRLAIDSFGTIWVYQLLHCINNQQNHIKMLRFCERNQYKTHFVRTRKKVRIVNKELGSYINVLIMERFRKIEPAIFPTPKQKSLQLTNIELYDNVT